MQPPRTSEGLVSELTSASLWHDASAFVGFPRGNSSKRSRETKQEEKQVVARSDAEEREKEREREE